MIDIGGEMEKTAQIIIYCAHFIYLSIYLCLLIFLFIFSCKRRNKEVDKANR